MVQESITSLAEIPNYLLNEWTPTYQFDPVEEATGYLRQAENQMRTGNRASNLETGGIWTDPRKVISQGGWRKGKANLTSRQGTRKPELLLRRRPDSEQGHTTVLATLLSSTSVNTWLNTILWKTQDTSDEWRFRRTMPRWRLIRSPRLTYIYHSD